VAGGKVTDASDTRPAYVAKLMEFVDVSALTPMKVLVNAGNGAAGPTFDAIADALEKAGAPLEFIRVDHAPDGSFPNGIPNPLLDDNQPKTAGPVVEHGADIGVAWDGDFDRCFFFDHEGGFIAGEYVVGLLAEAFLAKEPGEKIIHDPRVIWATQDIVAKLGGEAIQSKCGHSFIKEKMRETGAIYGGRDVGASLFPRLHGLRFGHDPVASGGGTGLPPGRKPEGPDGRTPRRLPVLGRGEFPGGGRQDRDRADRGDLCPQGRGARRHRRALAQLRGLALQPARVEHRAACCG
jgi:hypothetical protein